MGRLLLVLSILTTFVICPSLLFAGDFREANWGMSLEDVKKLETQKLQFEKKGFLGYADKVLGMDVMVMYRFVDDKFTHGEYSFETKHTNKNDYIQDYKKIKAALSQKYGKPKEDIFWKNDLYKNKYEEWGFAVGLGHLSYFSTWNNIKTKTMCALYGDDDKHNLVLEYRTNNPELKALAEEVKRNKDAG